jgi:hypothetical protein
MANPPIYPSRVSQGTGHRQLTFQLTLQLIIQRAPRTRVF